jgi:hypothetical protein
MQHDGNLVLYSGGAAIWASGTSGRHGALLGMLDDGNLVMFQNGAPFWATNTSYAGEPGCGFVGENGALAPNQGVRSCSGRYLFIHQGDGNVVMYEGSRPIWASGTSGRATTALIMQGDGNLVLYDGGHPVWASGTHGHAGGFLGVQDDGNVVIYSGGRAIWSTR